MMNTISSALLDCLAENDVLADNLKTQQFFDAIPHPNKQCITLPNAYHEVLNETNRETTYQEILDWISHPTNHRT